MTTPAELVAARAEVARARAHVSVTIDEIETRLTAPVKAAKQRLDVAQLVRDHPWPALATALGLGVLVSASGSDARAAMIAREKIVDTGAAAVRGARGLPSVARNAAQGATRAAGSYVDGLAGSLLLAFIERLRDPSASRTPPR